MGFFKISFGNAAVKSTLKTLTHTHTRTCYPNFYILTTVYSHVIELFHFCYETTTIHFNVEAGSGGANLNYFAGCIIGIHFLSVKYLSSTLPVNVVKVKELH